MADQNENISATVPEQPESKPPLRKSMPVVIALVVIVALVGIANVSSLLNGNKRSASQSALTVSPTTPNAQQVSSFQTQQQQQARRDAEEPAARAVLDEAGRRLAAMAAVHQMLYRAEQIGGLRADRFMTELAASILRPLGAEGRATVCASPDAAVPNDAAVPLALILNELLANAVKHGPPGGRIRATLAEHGSSFELTVEDEGPGFVPPLSSRRTSGLALVRGLVRQLGGKFAVERREPSGARCLVRVDSRRDAGSEARA